MQLALTSKGRIAVTAMVDLALRSPSGPVVLATISARQRISPSYLEQLFGKLRHHGLVRSLRGKGGGYLLGRRSADISVADILAAIDKPPLAAGRSAEAEWEGVGAGRCLTDELWDELSARLLEHLDAVSLQTLVDEQVAKGVRVEAAPPRRAMLPWPAPAEPIGATAPNSVFALGSASQAMKTSVDR